MTENLRDLLERAAPLPGLSPAERSDAVVRRGRAARRRDRALAAVAGVAVVVTAVVVPVALRGGGDGGRTPVPAAPAPTASPCPAEPSPVDGPGTVLDPGDVVAVRACPAAGAQGEPLPGVPLEGDAAAAFAADLGALPAWRMPDFCVVANLVPQPWLLQVDTADGSTYLFGSTMRTCSSVSISGEERGVDGVLAAFVGNLARQESGVPDLACPQGEWLAEDAPTWNASFDPATAVAGVACYRADPLGQSDFGHATSLGGSLSPDTSDQLPTVRDDLAANRSPTGDGGTCTDTGPQRMIVLEDADGDQAAWVDDRCTGEYLGPGGYWTPGPAAARAIDEALSGS